MATAKKAGNYPRPLHFRLIRINRPWLNWTLLTPDRSWNSNRTSSHNGPLPEKLDNRLILMIGERLRAVGLRLPTDRWPARCTSSGDTQAHYGNGGEDHCLHRKNSIYDRARCPVLTFSN
jgi:hypothetical protein